MIKISDEIKPLLLENSIHREVIIRFPNAADGEIQEIGSSNIISESFELKHSICDKEFVMGGCIAGQLTIRVIGIEQNLNDKRINVFIVQTYSKGDLLPSDTLFPAENVYLGPQKDTIEKQIFSGTIDSSKRQKNRSVKEIIAYDDMYKMSQTKCGAWFRNYVINDIIKPSSGTTLRGIGMNLIGKYDEINNTDVGGSYVWIGFNDFKKISSSNMDINVVNSVIKDDTTIADLLKAYCELNALFAIINPYGQIKMISLYNQQSTANTEKKVINESIDSYADLDFEEYETKPITYIRFSYKKDQYFDYGSSTKQSNYISDNIITSCCTDVGELVCAFNNNKGNNYIFGDLYSYRPFSADVYARFWLEPGDKVKIKTGYDDVETIESFVFERTIKGINGMRVTIKAQGPEYLGKDEIKS